MKLKMNNKTLDSATNINIMSFYTNTYTYIHIEMYCLHNFAILCLSPRCHRNILSNYGYNANVLSLFF
jgi:hypothetical protein